MKKLAWKFLLWRIGFIPCEFNWMSYKHPIWWKRRYCIERAIFNIIKP